MSSAALADKPTAVYRFYDAAGQLLYVGITLDMPSRFRDHQLRSQWWPDQRSVLVVWRDTRTQALDEERVAIRSEAPRYNIAGTRAPIARVRADRPDPETTRCIAAQVRAEIARSGHSKAEVRDLLGLGIQSLWQRTRGRIPFSEEELLTLAEFLDVPVDRFLAPLPVGTYA